MWQKNLDDLTPQMAIHLAWKENGRMRECEAVFVNIRKLKKHGYCLEVMIKEPLLGYYDQKLLQTRRIVDLRIVDTTRI